MQRRRFIQALGGAAALLKSSSALASSNERDNTPDLMAVYVEAVRQGRALLVLVVPDDGADFMARGKLLGGWLVHGKPERLAPLVFTELACATVAEIHALVPHADVGAKPVAVLIETTAVPAVVKVVVPEPVPEEAWRLDNKDARQLATSYRDAEYVSTLTDSELREELSTQLRWREDEQRLPLSVEALSKAVYTMLGPDEATSMRRVEQLRARDPATAALAAQWVQSQRIDRLMAAEDLRDKLHLRAVDNRIAGSSWARDNGCGISVVGRPSDSLFLCGMGHVPTLSATFLYFFHRS